MVAYFVFYATSHVQMPAFFFKFFLDSFNERISG